MKRLFLLLVFLGLSVSCFAQSRKVKTINVVPDNAKIILGGAEVGQGSYSLSVGKADYVMLKLTCPGYVDRVVRIYKADKRNAITFTLEEDDAFSASEANADLANKYMTVNVREGLSAEDVWKRLILTVSDLFPNLEVSDKQAGWIRSAWMVERFAYVTVRTRIEIKEVMGQDTPRYRVRLQSEIASNDCGTHDECFKKWDRVLKTYNETVLDLVYSIQ